VTLLAVSRRGDAFAIPRNPVAPGSAWTSTYLRGSAVCSSVFSYMAVKMLIDNCVAPPGPPHRLALQRRVSIAAAGMLSRLVTLRASVSRDTSSDQAGHIDDMDEDRKFAGFCFRILLFWILLDDEGSQRRKRANGRRRRIKGKTGGRGRRGRRKDATRATQNLLAVYNWNWYRTGAIG